MESDQISPELVLVSPELGEHARGALPERPWELVAPVAAADIVPLSRPRAAHTLPTSRAARLVALAPGVLLLAFAVVIVVGSLPWLGQRPSLAPEPTVTQTTPRSSTVPSRPSSQPPTGARGAVRPGAGLVTHEALALR